MTSQTPNDTLPRRAADVFVVATALALVAGTLHALVSWARRDVLHDLLRTWMSPDTAWMAPLGYLLLFVPVALLLTGVVAVFSRLPALRLSAFVFGTLAAFSVLLLFPRLHQYASLLLGVGIAARLAASVGSDVARWRRRLVRTALVLGAVGLGAWGYQSMSRSRHERGALASLGSAPSGAPNVLLLILDTVRASSLSLYDAERPTTPTLVRLARESTVFDWAWSTAPWTLPSHASMFTGRYASQQTGNWTTPLDGAHATLASVLASYGYVTGGFTANLVATPRGFGLDRGFARYEDHPHSLTQVLLTTSLGQANSLRNAAEAVVRQRWLGRAVRELAKFDFEPRYSYPDNDVKTADDVSQAFLRWQAAHAERPFFAFLNFFDAHGPYESPARYDTLFGPSDRVRDKYDRSIRYIDDVIAALTDSLARRGLLDRTVVIITADHGEQFGEHGLSWHSNSLYEQLTHVPLLVRFPPRVPAGHRVVQSVSLRDLGATIVDLAGLPDARGLEGRSLASTWDGSGAGTSAAVAELSRGVNPDSSALNARGDMRALADDSLHYIRNGDGSFALYAFRRDPREETDLARGPLAALAPQYDDAIRRALAAAPRTPARGTPPMPSPVSPRP